MNLMEKIEQRLAAMVAHNPTCVDLQERCRAVDRRSVFSECFCIHIVFMCPCRKDCKSA